MKTTLIISLSAFFGCASTGPDVSPQAQAALEHRWKMVDARDHEKERDRRLIASAYFAGNGAARADRLDRENKALERCVQLAEAGPGSGTCSELEATTDRFKKECRAKLGAYAKFDRDPPLVRVFETSTKEQCDRETKARLDARAQERREEREARERERQQLLETEEAARREALGATRMAGLQLGAAKADLEQVGKVRCDPPTTSGTICRGSKKNGNLAIILDGAVAAFRLVEVPPEKLQPVLQTYLDLWGPARSIRY
ncbi:MAG: hypothetical protein AAF658_06740, partial [Myxococcota bacterium]